MNPFNNEDIRAFIDSIPKEEIERQNHLQEEENERIHIEFIDGLKLGKCFLCGSQMDTFEVNTPCFHWFTYPNGIKKKHFEKYLENPIGFFQLDSYFRWLANSERPIGNINDLKDETSLTSFIETTYKYKNLEWAFSVGHTDKDGHSNSKIGTEPHFHIQMKINDRVFLRFNDFHIPFSDGDLFTIAMLEQAPDKVKLGYNHGIGIGILEDEENIEIIDDALSVTDDFENATFIRQTLIQAPEGQTISGEIILKALEESERTRKPVGKILQRLLSDAKIMTIITPGKGIPEMTKRSGKK